MKPTLPALVLALCALAPASARGAPEVPTAAFRVAGAVDAPGEWSATRILKELPSDVREVALTSGGRAWKAKCVSLLALVEAAKPKVDPKVKGHRLAFVVAVRAADGYQAAFSMGELLPEYGKREVRVALDHDGAPLDAQHAPASILVPAEEKTSRWIRGVASITVIDTASAVSQGEAPR